ncbi:hypothetical protein GY45DRAFT_782158 [Cubamyces sp. BRFM 1775]|nr:hypothetical protein GY45DRAFT_782158 [Cubamyces sp. BRFM 1775]
MPLKKPKVDDGWSLSLRGRCTGDEGFSDESDNDDAPSESLPASEESRLLGELDLASRVDAATYKPNPWSIARANAATRTTKPTAAVSEKPHRQKNKNPDTSVLELLRKQARKPPTSEGQSTALPAIFRNRPSAATTRASRSSPQPHATSCFEDDAHIPSDETLVDDDYQPRVLCKSGGNALICPLVTRLDSGYVASSGTVSAVSASPEAQAGQLVVQRPPPRHGQAEGSLYPTASSQRDQSVRIGAQLDSARNMSQPMSGDSQGETDLTSKHRYSNEEDTYSLNPAHDTIGGRLTPHTHSNPHAGRKVQTMPHRSTVAVTIRRSHICLHWF